MTDSVAGYEFGYDIMGRMTNRKMSISGQFTLDGQFSFNYIGGLSNSRWPGIFDYAGFPLGIYYDFENAGRQTFSRRSNNNGNPGGTAYQLLVDGYTRSHSNSGSTEVTDLSNNTLEAISYNNRLQPYSRVVTNPSTIFNLWYDHSQVSVSSDSWHIGGVGSRTCSNQNQNLMSR